MTSWDNRASGVKLQHDYSPCTCPFSSPWAMQNYILYSELPGEESGRSTLAL